MSEANKDLVRRHFEVLWNKDELALADEMMAEDYVENALAPFGSEAPGHVSGPDHIRGVVQWLKEQFPDITFRIDAIISEGELVAARIFSEGTNLGPLGGVIPPTGKKMGIFQTHWFRVTDGKLAEHWATRDDLTGMLQLGVLQPAGPPS
jgi:predicted ester cyclase